eukprot:566564-Pyramimonas_sp.AAC.1
MPESRGQPHLGRCPRCSSATVTSALLSVIRCAGTAQRSSNGAASNSCLSSRNSVCHTSIICASRSASDSSWIVGGRPSSCGGSASGASLALSHRVGMSASSSIFVMHGSKLA